MRKKFLTVLLCVGMAMGLLAGCGDGDASTDGQNGSEGEEESVSGEVRMAYWDVSFDGYLNRCIEEFNKLYPDVEIILEPSTSGEFWTKLEAASTGGSAADVFWMNGPNITKYARGGVLMPIDEFLEDSELDLGNYPESMVQLYNIDGKQYGVPFCFDTVGVWYNKDIFDEAGVPYPEDDWTWEEMVDIARQLTREDGSVYGIAAPVANQTAFYNTICAMGGEVISEDKKSSGYDKPETQAGIQCWVDLQKEGLSPSLASLTESPADAQFLSGRVAMYWNGSWFASTVAASELSDSIDVAELPSLNGTKATVIHGSINAISKNTENPVAAWKWVEFLSGETANTICAEEGVIPAMEGTAEKWVSAHPQYNLQSFITSAEEYSYPYPVSANTAVWNQYETDYLKQAYGLEMEVKEACDLLAEKMNEALAKEE